MNAPAFTLTAAESGIGFRKCVALWFFLSLQPRTSAAVADGWAADVNCASASLQFKQAQDHEDGCQELSRLFEAI
jgi:hypothetical protein